MWKAGAKLDPQKVIIVIPARYGSTRLPGKPLVSLGGKPMIQRGYEGAKESHNAARGVVATDDERSVKAVEGFGSEARFFRAGRRPRSELIADAAAFRAGQLLVKVQ